MGIPIDAVQLLKHALNRISPDQASKLLEESDIVFGIGGTYAKFSEGSLKDMNGNPVSGGISAITSVKTEEEVNRILAARKGNPEAGNDEADFAAHQRRSDPNRATQHTLLGGGTTRTLSPTKQDGVNVVGGNVAGNDHNRLENLATGGQATGGFEAQPDQAGVQALKTPEEAKRIADEARAKSAQAKAEQK